MKILMLDAPNIGGHGQTSRLMPDTALCAAPHVRMQLDTDEERFRALAESLQTNPPHGVVTVTRGSADHAASYLAYLVMTRTGQLVTAMPASLLTLHKAPLASHGLLAVAISRSACCQDLVESMQIFRRAGSTTIALTDTPDSPLSHAVEWSMPLHAGREVSTSEPRNFLCSLVAAARLSVHWPWGTHWDFRAALHDIPAALEQACQQDWSAAVEALQSARRATVIGCGAGLAIAREAALQLKEVCGIAAEAFSAAEFKHRTPAHLNRFHPILVLAPRGPAQSRLIELAAELRLGGAYALLAAPADVSGRTLTLVHAPHRDLDPISAMQSFYLLLEAVARVRALAAFNGQ
jgi:glucosamine--fructose-6-phosphate aminotransferase (isomerizing)